MRSGLSPRLSYSLVVRQSTCPSVFCTSSSGHLFSSAVVANVARHECAENGESTAIERKTVLSAWCGDRTARHYAVLLHNITDYSETIGNVTFLAMSLEPRERLSCLIIFYGS